MRIPDAPDLRFTNAMTVEAWIKPSSYNGTQIIASKWDGTDGNNPHQDAFISM